MTPTIEAHGIEKRYGKTRALNGLELTAEPGQVVALLGPNGSGKTTFVRAVATLLGLDGGTLRVAGHDVRRDPTAVRQLIGLAGQFAAVEPAMTGRENLEMVARLFGQDRRTARASARSVLERIGLVNDAERLVRSYSGGMRRRLDLGASLVGAPRLLLLDEPTTGLDPAGRREVWDAVRGLAAAGTDILLTTHYLDEADELADHVVVIDHGRTVASGTLGDLKASVGGDVIEVVPADPSRLDAVGHILERVTSHPPRLDRTSRRASAPTTAGAAELATVIGCLALDGIPVDEIGVRRPTLDEVFLALTGDPAGAPTAGASTAGHRGPKARAR
jgi:ABC-2 type transport system ATP-binding protein